MMSLGTKTDLLFHIFLTSVIHMNWAGSFTKKFAGLVFALSAFCVSDGPGIIRVRESYLNHLNDRATWNLPCHIAWTALAYTPSWSLIIRTGKGKGTWCLLLVIPLGRVNIQPYTQPGNIFAKPGSSLSVTRGGGGERERERETVLGTTIIKQHLALGVPTEVKLITLVLETTYMPELPELRDEETKLVADNPGHCTWKYQNTHFCSFKNIFWCSLFTFLLAVFSNQGLFTARFMSAISLNRKKNRERERCTSWTILPL